MLKSKNIVLFGTNRHAICIDDYYMFYKRTDHRIAHIFYPIGTHKNRDWWEIGSRTDAARQSIVEPMTDYKGDVTIWEDLEKQVFPVLDRLSFDHICLGNGTDPAHQALVARYGREKILFTEYGWLPWSRHFYISREGAGVESEIARIPPAYLDSLTVNKPEIERFHAVLDTGNAFDYDKFIYMPLQKDVNDFKFLYNEFKDNVDYLKFVDAVVPPEFTILVKCHPLYKKKYDLSFSRRMVDITDAELNKHEMYRRMAAMVCLNSTSILEALAYNAKVFTYGDDLFLNKDITYHRIKTMDEFSRCMGLPVNGDRAQKFVSLLLSRQIDRARCVADDRSYVARHYWNLCL